MTQLKENFFEPLIKKATELLHPKKIILFGSFARGDARSNSDIDLAFDFDFTNNWPRFKDWVETDFNSLRQFDLVDMNNADPSILNSIEREGKILYERKD